MTLLEAINHINIIAGQQPNINTIVTSGNVYDLNTENYTVKYSAFCATQQPHTQTGNFITYNFTLFYVDRLTDDKRNKNEVQSNAISVLQAIVNKLQDLDMVHVGNNRGVSNINISDSIQYTTFTERFTAECAGAYCNVGITSTADICYDDIKQLLGEFSYDFSDAFLVRK